MAQAKQQTMTEAEFQAALASQKRNYASAALAMSACNPGLSAYYIIRSQSDELDPPSGLADTIMLGLFIALGLAAVVFVAAWEAALPIDSTLSIRFPLDEV